MPRITVHAEVETKANSKLKDERGTLRVREEVFRYLHAEADRVHRSGAQELEFIAELHRRMKKLFGTDDADYIEAEVQRLRKQVGEATTR